MFGGKSTFGSTTFGASTQQPVFGAAQPQTNSLFGAARPTVSFGAQPAQQTTTGGLFGTPAASAANTGGLFGSGGSLFGSSMSTSSGTSTGLFGSATTTTAAPAFGGGAGSLFSFSGTQPAAAQTTGSLFGSTTAGGGLFSAPATAATATQGTPIKYNPLIGQDQMARGGATTQVSTKHHCIAAMKEYENKSLEELRCEDYILNRKGPQQQQALSFAQPQQQQSLTLFGQPQQQASTSLFGATTAQPQSTGLFGASQPTTGGLFGQSTAVSKPLFGQTTTPMSGAGSAFGFGAPSTSTAGVNLFGATQPAAAPTGGSLFGGGGGLFGAHPTSTAQATTGLFGTTATSQQQQQSAFSFGKPAQATTSLFGQPQQQQQQPSLFGMTSSAAPSTGFSFGGPTTSAATPAFGAGSSLFAPKSTTATAAPFGTSAFGTSQASTGLFSTQQPAFSFGGTQQQQQQPTGGLFGQTTAQAKPFGAGAGLFGSGTISGFGQTQTTATQPSFNLFSSQGMNTQAAKPGGFTFGATGAPVLGSTGQQQPVQIGTDQATLAAQQTLIQCHLKGMAQSPYGDSKLLQLLKGRQVQSPTSTSSGTKSTPSFPSHSLFAGSFVASPTVLDIKPIPPARPSPRVLTMSINLNASQSRDKRLIAPDLDSDKLTFSEGYVPKRNVKKLILGRTADKVKKDSDGSASLSAQLNTSSGAQNASIFDDRDAITTQIRSKPIGAPLPLNLEDSVNITVDVDRKGSEKSPIEYLSPIKPSTTPRHISFAPTVTSKIENAEHDSIDSKSCISSPADNSSIYPKLPPASEDSSRDRTRILGECSNLMDAKKIDEEKRRSSIDIFESSLKIERPKKLYPAGMICTKSDYYTVPDLEDLAAAVGPDGKCYVDGFTVGRRDYGSVFWPGYVDLTNLNIDSLIHFRHKEITVYPDDTTKPAVGEGLNKTAEVTLERVWPNDKNTHMPIKDVKRLETMRFREKLERASAQMGAQFIDYRPDTGSWVFKVSHFSKYGLLDDNGESELPMDAAMNVSPQDLTYDKVQRQKVNMEPQNMDLDKSNAGLGGYSFPALDEDYAELSDTEPSILVKSDLSVEDNERLSHLKHQLFYEPSFTKDESVRRIDDYLDIPKSQLKKQCLVNDLYERSMQLLDSKSFSKFDFSHIDSKFMTPTGKLADMSASSGSSTALTRLSTLRLIPPKNTLKMLPFENSLLKNLTHFYADSGAFNGRRFRCGWTANSKFLKVAYTKEVDKRIQPRASLFNTAPDLSQESLFSEIALMETTSNDDIRTNLIELLLDVQLLNSVRYNRSGCPCFVPTNGVQSIDRYLKLIYSEEWKQFPCPDKDYFAGVIRLCAAFWGSFDENKTASQYALEMLRKENLMDWLANASKNLENEKLVNSESLKDVLDLISMGDLELAAEYAFKSGDFRLALSITQLGDSEAVKSLYQQQLSQWYQSQADRHIDVDRLKIYVLLAGLLQWKTSSNVDINPFENLTWQQSMSLCLRYCSPSIYSIADCVKLYDSAWSESGNGLTVEPKAEYCKHFLSSSQKSGAVDFNFTSSTIERRRLKNDVRYHLIKLFCERSYRLESVLNNATWTSDALSFYLSWHLWCVLSAAGYTYLPEHTKNSLHLQYACQLERCGLWPWSIFVVMHISGDSDRERAVKHFLSIYAHSAGEDVRNFLRNDLSIPEKWFNDAKSLKDQYCGKLSDQDRLTIS